MTSAELSPRSVEVDVASSHEVHRVSHATKRRRELFNKFFQPGSNPEEEKHPEDGQDKKEKLKQANQHMIQKGCSHMKDDGTWQFKPLSTSLKELGEYGVGVQLYFEWLWYLGLVFAFLFLFSIPQMYFFASGTLIEDFPETSQYSWWIKLLSVITPANLGHCPRGQCTTDASMAQRELSPDSTTRVRDITTLLGVLDLFSCLIFLFFVLWFAWYHVPKIVRIQDEQHTTGADFGVEVSCLPRRLETQDHHHYRQLLKDHFIAVLKLCGVPADEANDAVHEVTLIREYDGCILKFQEQGNEIEMMNEAITRWRKAKLSQPEDEKKMKAAKKMLLKHRQNIIKHELSLKHQASMSDLDRDVCGAFIMFQKEDYKQTILQKYAPSAESWIARKVQPHNLRFQNTPLHVVQACEPNDLCWENLDYTYAWHLARKFGTMSLCLLVLLCCVFLLTYLRRDREAVDTRTSPHDLWFFSATSHFTDPDDVKPCLSLCELRLSLDAECADAVRARPLISTDLWRSSDIESISWVSDNRQSGIEEHDWTTGAHVTMDGVEQCQIPWQSKSCSSQPRAGGPPSAGELAERSIGIEFMEPTALKCLNVQPYLQGGYLAISGCDSLNFNETVEGPVDQYGDKWSVETHCVRYQSVPLGDFKSDLRIRQDAGCLDKVEIKTVEFALKQVGGGDLTNKMWQDDPRVRCFCWQQIDEDPMLRIPKGLPGARDNRQQELCAHIAAEKNGADLMRYAGILIVVALNQVMLAVFAYMDALGKYRTNSDLANSQMVNLFGAELLNTAVVYFIIGLNLHNQVEGTILSALKFGEGAFDDVSPEWFLSVGNNLVIVIGCQAACTFAFPPLWVNFVDTPLRWLFSMSHESQEMLNEVHELPEWTKSLRVAENLVIVFCVMAYSGSFPILYVLGVVYCFFSYWADKYALLRGSRQPPQYTAQLITRAAFFMPFSVLFHLAFGLWAFGNQRLFPSDWGGLLGFMQFFFNLSTEEYNKYVDIFGSSGTDVQDEWYGYFAQARALDMGRDANLPLLLLFIAMVIYYAVIFISWLLRGLPVVSDAEFAVGSRFNRLLRKIGLNKTARDESETLTAAKKRLADAGSTRLMSYSLNANPKYEEVVEALAFDPPEEVMQEALEAQNTSSTLRTIAATLGFGGQSSTQDQLVKEEESKEGERFEVWA
eukprot:TRINITY_DN106330_c1_g1_i1.p1 TRINITY_DN106330_c1_g1~~TRINITY_DN106330_c1_g1_i1.p1  ORF type:complete len:1176 (-),score=181.63 TRINITY_DN106330_c1_g1_i1:93-3620(-)